MSTVISNDANKLDNPSSQQPASKKILKSTYEIVLAALNSNKKIILVTGDTKKGKSALLHTISKDMSSTHRTISLSGKDLPSTDSANADAESSDLSTVRDFIIASTDLDDKLIVTLDDADYLPTDFLSDLISSITTKSVNDHGLQLVLTGSANFKDQLLSIESLDDTDFIHCPMESLNKDEILKFAKNKTYKISSNIKNLKYEKEALSALSDFSLLNKQLLDVALEWCSALVKKDQLDLVSLDTVTRAINFARQFSKDKNLRLENSYPPSHEVYKFINGFQSRTSTYKQNEKRESFIKTPNKTDSNATKIPTITANVSNAKKHTRQGANEELLSNDSKNSELDNDVMSVEWTPKDQKASANRMSFPAILGLLAVLVLGYVLFINNRIETNITNNAPSKESVANNQPVENDNELSSPNEREDNVNKIISTDIGDPKPEVAPLALGKVDSSLFNTGDSINNLLKLAEYQFENKQLSTPPGDNALETYQKILELEPNNQTAIDGIKKVHGKYLSWANYYSKNNDTELAKQFYNKALSIDQNDKIALEGLQNIERQKTAPLNSDISSSTQNILNDSAPSESIDRLLVDANEKMLQIESDIKSDQRNFKIYKEAQSAYENILKSQPQNLSAQQGLSSLMDYYVDWAELQIQNRNYNIAIFLYGQALSIEPDNNELTDRIDQLRKFKKPL